MGIETVSISFRHDDINSLSLIKELIEFLHSKKKRAILQDCPIIKNTDLAEYVVHYDEFIKCADLVVVIGGDGTFLRTARMFVGTDKPIFGINRGRLGFLTEFGPHEYLIYLEEIFEGHYNTVERQLIVSDHIRKGSTTQSLCFLNDAVISKGAFSRAIRIDLEIDGEFLSSYSGDGLIVSTSTGSTAYSLSAGGPIIIPSAHNVYLLNPVCPHTLAMRPMVIPITSVLKVRIFSEFNNLLLTIDGQEAIRIEGDDEILFHQSDKKILLITHPKKNFYAILREKLGWGL